MVNGGHPEIKAKAKAKKVAAAAKKTTKGKGQKTSKSLLTKNIANR